MPGKSITRMHSHRRSIHERTVKASRHKEYRTTQARYRVGVIDVVSCSRVKTEQSQMAAAADNKQETLQTPGSHQCPKSRDGERKWHTPTNNFSKPYPWHSTKSQVPADGHRVGGRQQRIKAQAVRPSCRLAALSFGFAPRGYDTNPSPFDNPGSVLCNSFYTVFGKKIRTQ